MILSCSCVCGTAARLSVLPCVPARVSAQAVGSRRTVCIKLQQQDAAQQACDVAGGSAPVALGTDSSKSSANSAPSLLEAGEAEHLIRHSSRSWQCMLEFLTAHSCHVPAVCVPVLCGALLRLCFHPATSVGPVSEAIGSSPFTRYPDLLRELLRATGGLDSVQGNCTAARSARLVKNSGDDEDGHTHAAEAQLHVVRSGSKSATGPADGPDAPMGSPVEQFLQDALRWEHDSAAWGPQHLTAIQALQLPGSLSSSERSVTTGWSVEEPTAPSKAHNPTTAAIGEARRRVWHANGTSPRRRAECARRTLLLLVSAVSSAHSALQARNLDSPAHAALLAAVLCEVSAHAGLLKFGSRLTWAGEGLPHSPAASELLADVRGALLALVRRALLQLDHSTPEPGQIDDLMLRSSLALVVASLGLATVTSSTQHPDSTCLSAEEWDGLIASCIPLLEKQDFQHSHVVAVTCCAALLWSQAAVTRQNGGSDPSCARDADRHGGSVLASLRAEDLSSPAAVLDCVWVVTTQLHKMTTTRPQDRDSTLESLARATPGAQELRVLHPSRPAPAILDQLLQRLLVPAHAQQPDSVDTQRRCILTPVQTVSLLACLAQAGLRLHGSAMQALQTSLCHGHGQQLSVAQIALAVWAVAKMRTAMQAKSLRALLGAYQKGIQKEPRVSVGSMATLVWALPHVSRPYTRFLVVEQRALLRELADRTLPSVLAVTEAASAGRARTEPATAAELVQLAVGFTRLAYYPGAAWMRAHRQACLAMQQLFSVADRQRLRTAYQTLLQL